MYRINKELSILVISRIAQIVILLVSIKISTALLSPTEIGNLYLIMSICSFFGFFLINPIGQYVNRKTHEWHDNGVILNKLFNYNYYIILTSISSYIVLLVLYSLGIANNIAYTFLILFIPLFVFFNTWNQTIIPIFNMLEKWLAFTILTISTLFLSLLFSYLLIKSYKPEGIIWFLGQITGLGLMAIIALIYFVRTMGNNLNITYAHQEITWINLKHIARFAIPLSIGVLFLWMQNQSYRLIIEKYIGAEFLGYFGVGMAISSAISTSFETIVMQFLYPKMYRHMNDEAHFKIIFSNIINLILPIYFLLAIFVSYMAIYLTAILVDAKFSSSSSFVIFGIWIEFFRMSSNLISTIAHSKMQTKTLIMPYASGGLFVAVGTYYASGTQSYAILVPIVLLVGGLLTFWQIFRKMNNIVSFDLRITSFIRVLPYTLVFFLSALFYSYSTNLFYSILITLIFGMYFLFVLFKKIKSQGFII
jgi:O-antigen/teichoic acid export membrane protein